MNKLDLYIYALKKQMDKIIDKESLVYKTIAACYELATSINKM
jgi:hypothetical protein